jgi:hypothetical protein
MLNVQLFNTDPCPNKSFKFDKGFEVLGFVTRDKIKHVTGHKSTTSIEAYDDRLSDDEQCDYSDVLTGAKSSIVPVTKQSNENARINLSPWNTR